MNMSATETRSDPPDEVDLKTTVTDARDRIRASIFSGELGKGAILSQGQLAEQMGVSRTPMREALRMLQEEGLVEIEPNRRARVIGFDADDLELVYSSRIILTAIATTLTVPLLTDNDIQKMRDALAKMEKAGAEDDMHGWQVADRSFHALHCSKAPAAILREIEHLFSRSALYRRLRVRDMPHRQTASQEDHHGILSACSARNAENAMVAVIRHNARIALTLLAHTAPDHDPKSIRTSVQLLVGKTTALELPVAAKPDIYGIRL